MRVDVYPNAVTTEHTDGLAVDYINNSWVLKVRDRDRNIAYEPNEIIMYAAPNAETVQPGDPNFDFIGAGAGNPVWILPQLQDPNLLYVGASSSETPGSPFAPYFESDPRIGFTAPWITIKLLAVRGPGHFSVWQTDSFGAVIVWVATSDGIGSTDKLFSLVGAHIHYSWGFTAPGDYEIDIQASAYLQFPNNQTFSNVRTFQFTVDNIDNGDPPQPIPPPTIVLRSRRVDKADQRHLHIGRIGSASGDTQATPFSRLTTRVRLNIRVNEARDQTQPNTTTATWISSIMTA